MSSNPYNDDRRFYFTIQLDTKAIEAYELDDYLIKAIMEGNYEIIEQEESKEGDEIWKE